LERNLQSRFPVGSRHDDVDQSANRLIPEELMKLNHVRALGLCGAPFVTIALGFCLQACGGAPDGNPSGTSSAEKTGQTSQDLTIVGVTIPQPTIMFGLGDASAKIDPVGIVDTLLAEQGIHLPDPVKPVDDVITGLGKPISAGVGAGDGAVGVKLPPIIPPELGGIVTGLDPFQDAGIPLIGK
jgi:hypothetical protein